MKFLLAAIAFMILGSAPSFARTFQVGPTRLYAAPSKVMGLVSDGDTVAIDSGLYKGDVGAWNNNNLYIHCPNGTAHLDAAGQNAQGKGIWVVYGNNTTVEHIEFSGATVPDQNGCGIRMQGNGLTVRYCYFHDNDEGVLSGDSPDDILFEYCEFDHNGFGDGYSHNMYIGHVRNFTLRFCYVHRAKIGHNVKSRALNTFITYNRIMDEQDGTSSYTIDIPNGGNAYIIGNSIMKGPLAQNTPLIRYGEEGFVNPAKQLYVVNNTLVTEHPNSVFVYPAPGTDTAVAINNIFCGPGSITSGAAVDTISNVYSLYQAPFGFQDSATENYFPFRSPKNGVDPGTSNGVSLRPDFMMGIQATAQGQFFAIVRTDSTSPALGAFDPNLAAIPIPSEHERTPSVFPNPCNTNFTIELGNDIPEGTQILIKITDMLGRVVKTIQTSESATTISTDGLTPSVYNVSASDLTGRSLIKSSKIAVIR